MRLHPYDGSARINQSDDAASGPLKFGVAGQQKEVSKAIEMINAVARCGSQALGWDYDADVSVVQQRNTLGR